MPIKWRNNKNTVASFINPSSLSGLGKKVTVGPYELVVIMRNGEVTEIFEEGQIKTLGVRDSLKRLGGFGPELSVMVVDTSPFILTYWLDNPDVKRHREVEDSFDIPVLTKDSKQISAQVNLNFIVSSDQPHLLMRMMHGSKSITKNEIGKYIGDEFLAKSLSREVSKYNLSDLRGNDDLLQQIWEQAEMQLDSTLKSYGLILENIYINWGLVPEEINNQNQSDSENNGINVGRDYISTTTSGLSGVNIVSILGIVLLCVIILIFLLNDELF